MAVAVLETNSADPAASVAERLGAMRRTDAELQQDGRSRGERGKRLPSIVSHSSSTKAARSASSSSRFMAAGPVDIHAGERAPQPRLAPLPHLVGFCLGIRAGDPVEQP